jgi:hypothetical protein
MKERACRIPDCHYYNHNADAPSAARFLPQLLRKEYLIKAGLIEIVIAAKTE